MLGFEGLKLTVVMMSLPITFVQDVPPLVVLKSPIRSLTGPPEQALFPVAAQPLVRAFVSKVLQEAIEAVEADVPLWWPCGQESPQARRRRIVVGEHPQRVEVPEEADGVCLGAASRVGPDL